MRYITAQPSRCLLYAILCALTLTPTACHQPADTIRGTIIQVTDRNLAEIETLQIRDHKGQLWTFTTTQPLEKNGSHLRLHQTLNQTIQVTYQQTNGQLIATSLKD